MQSGCWKRTLSTMLGNNSDHFQKLTQEIFYANARTHTRTLSQLISKARIALQTLGKHNRDSPPPPYATKDAHWVNKAVFVSLWSGESEIMVLNHANTILMAL